MVGVAKDHLGTRAADLIDRHAFDRPLGSHRHECRGSARVHAGSKKHRDAPRSTRRGAGVEIQTGSCSRQAPQVGAAESRFDHDSDPVLGSVPTHFQTEVGQLFADFIQAGHAKVLALQHVIARLANQFANRS